MKGTERERLAELNSLYPIWEEHTLWTMFKRSCDRTPFADFIVDVVGTTYSYQDTKREIDKAAKSLLALGVKAGDHVSILMHNSPCFLFITFALARIGAVKNMINPNVGREELAYILRKCSADFVVSEYIIDDAFFKAVPTVQKLVVTGKNRLYRSDYSYFEDDLEKLAEEVSEEQLEAATVGREYAGRTCDITFTSGSTSAPKGVMLTHDMLLRTAYGSCLTRRFEQGRRICITVPLYHNHGYVEGMLAAMLMSGAVILASKRMTSELILRMVRDYRGNDLLTVPSQMMTLFEECSFDPSDVNSLHAVYNGAASTPSWVWSEIRKRFRVTDLITAFGMTEVTASTLMTRWNDPADYVEKYVGKVKEGGVAGIARFNGAQCEYRIADLESGEWLPAGSKGEICCRGVTVSQGYYDKGGPTSVLSRDGWFHTGDIGYFNGDGYLTFLGRGNDSYKTKGELVSPQFIDRIISACDLVDSVEVVGVRDRYCGEVGAAFIDARELSEKAKKEIYQYCRKNLSGFQVPKYFIYKSKELWPRTSVGKTQKYRLREFAEELIKNKEYWKFSER